MGLRVYLTWESPCLTCAMPEFDPSRPLSDLCITSSQTIKAKAFLYTSKIALCTYKAHSYRAHIISE